MYYPKFIKKNSLIGIPAPSGGARDEFKINRFKNAIKRMENLGYRLELSKNLYNNIKGRSTDSKRRAKEINDMFKNKDIDMIICASGGDFLVEILPYINFGLLKENPKLVAGFSDPTGLLFPITTKYDIATIYGQNFSSLGMEKLHESEENFIEIIKGNIIEQHSFDYYEEKRFETITGLEGHNLTEKVYWKELNNQEVNVTGRIVGGCFDIIMELSGTKYDGVKDFNEKYKNDGIIWYFDNCEISMEETIRVLWKFHELDYFKYTKAIIFGRFGENITSYDYDVKSCLEDSVISKLNIPIIYDADISHKDPSLTIINGSIANIKVKEGKGIISFKLN